MRRQRVWQHAGRELVLSVGACLDLPDLVAGALLATGDAERVSPVLERAALVAPETTSVRPRRKAAR